MSDTASNVLTVRGLSAGYGPIRVLTDVNIEISPDEVVGLAGLNGVGKTTTLRCISGVIARRADELTLDGQVLSAHGHVNARRGLVQVPEGRHVFGTLTVAENLRYGSVAGGRKDWRKRRDVVFGVFPRLAELLERRAGHLSGGEQQMLALARGLMGRSRLLMVDELSLGLSPKAAADISRALVDFAAREGLAMLLVDQNITLLRSTCDRLYVLRDGVTPTMSTTAEAASFEAVYF
jgi:branched-chain amino acid transport system ATP-binding protein